MKFLNNSKLIFAIVFLLAFAVLSKFEDRQFMHTIDFAATVKIQDKIDKSAHLRLAALVDNTMEGATFFAEPVFTSIIVIVLTFLAFKKYRFRSFFIPAAFVLIVLIELFGKTVIHHPSPPFAMIKHTTSVFPANYINEQFSYPSGHAARAMFLALVTWSLIRKKWLALGLALYVLLVSVSRIYLGHHWLSDVAGGIFIGGAFAGLVASSLTIR